MTFTVKFTDANGPLEAWKMRVLKVEARYKDKVLFQGQVDSIRLVDQIRKLNLLEFTATEAPRWEPFLREPYPGYEWSVDKARRVAEDQGYRLESIPYEVYPAPRYPREEVRNTSEGRYWLTGEQILRLAVAPYPGAFVKWNPDGSVGCTMAANRSIGTVLVSPDQVEMPDFETRIEDTPFRVALQSEQAWFPEIERSVAYFKDEGLRFHWIKTDNFKNWGPFIRLDNPINFSNTASSGLYLSDELSPAKNVFFLAADVIRGQITSPRTIRFHDDISPNNGMTAALFDTWEKHQNVKIDRLDTIETGPYRIIGGTLSITHGRTTHETTAVWASSHPEYGYPNEADVQFIDGDNLGTDKEFLPF